jgi:hypothetical protein
MGFELPEPPPDRPVPDRPPRDRSSGRRESEPDDLDDVLRDADLTSLDDLDEDSRSAEKTQRLNRVRRASVGRDADD